MLRKKPHGTVLASAHAVDREFRVLAALKDTAVPVPRAVCLCEDDSVLGAPFYIMEHLHVGPLLAKPLSAVDSVHAGSRVWHRSTLGNNLAVAELQLPATAPLLGRTYNNAGGGALDH